MRQALIRRSIQGLIIQWLRATLGISFRRCGRDVTPITWSGSPSLINVEAAHFLLYDLASDETFDF